MSRNALTDALNTSGQTRCQFSIGERRRAAPPLGALISYIRRGEVMRRDSSLLSIGLIGLMVAGVILAQSKSGNPQTGDVFSSGGGPDDRRKYVSPDGRNFD